MALVFAINIIFFYILVPYIAKETVPQTKRKIKSYNHKLANKQKGNVPKKHIPFFVHPMRIELISSEPESGILSIELRVHPIFRVQKYK